jgi:sialidase-1
MHPALVLVVIATAVLFWAGASAAAEDGESALWLHPKCRPMPTNLMGPFVRLPDASILTVSKGRAVDDCQVLVSTDEGANWANHSMFMAGDGVQMSSERALLCTTDGTVIVAFMNLHGRVWRWNSTIHDADPGTTLPTYAIRSTDGGKTWQDLTKLHDEWSGCVRNMIQTRSGSIVFTAMKLLNNPGRHSVLTYASADDGATWKGSNIIDLGGCGHHGGATEATAIELNDGRLWKLIRTNLGRFWSAYSDDQGQYWRTTQPSDIEASSAPGQMLRLASGRIALAWNRPLPEGKTEFPLSGGDNEWSEKPVSNHREELSIAFSEDEGKSWSKPVVLARQKGKWLAYPYLFERVPGELWVTTMQGDVRVSISEADFVQ